MHAQVRRVGGCEQPIRIRGRVDLLDTATGEVREAWTSDGEPDGTVLVACGNRRATRCAPCSRLYAGDAYQLIVAGLRGGKGAPATVAAHPALFVTLTAPGFGPVHTTRLGKDGTPAPCRPRRDEVCGHGRPAGCTARHTPGDPALGQPLCQECFDYEAAVLWNAHCGELWRRTRIRIVRELARLLHRSEKRVKGEVRVEYVKVAEYQRRGVLHFHLGVRLDGTATPFAAPPAEYTADLLADAITAAVHATEAPYPAPLGAGQGHTVPAEQVASATLDARPAPHTRLSGPPGVPYPAQALPPDDTSGRLAALRLHPRPALEAARWGGQLHIAAIPADDLAAEHAGVLSRGQVAGYLAKYATKHTEALGAALDRRITAADLPHLVATPHVRRFAGTALQLANRYPRRSNRRPLNLHRWAHQLGYGGHWLTKSRRWSTTFTALRQARKDHQAARAPDPLDQAGEHHPRHGAWQMTGVGYRLPGDTLLAQAARNDTAAAREALREQRAEHELAKALAA